jgi:hypothetical protein
MTREATSVLPNTVTEAPPSATLTLDLGALGLDAGAHVLVAHALRGRSAGQALRVQGSHPDLGVHLSGWCRKRGLAVDSADGVHWIAPGAGDSQRWRSASRAGAADLRQPNAVVEQPSARWGVAARGALVEDGGPEFHFPLSDKVGLWADDAARLYAAATAAQWDPDQAIDWKAPFELPDEVEDAVVQVMTYLVENENAALLVPARFLGQMHPHFREVLQCLAITIADEARHVEVFTRRIALKGRTPALSTAGAQASLKSLFDAPDFSVASFLLSVLGEGSFVNLLNFLYKHAPDPVTRQICRLAGIDEARHVAFGMSHLAWQIAHEPELKQRLHAAVESRFEELASTDGLNEEVFDALILLAAGAFTPEAVAMGYARVQRLKEEMTEGRRSRLVKLGFTPDAAMALSERHTRNFM